MKEAERSQKQHFIQQSKKIIWETKTPDNIPKWRKLSHELPVHQNKSKSNLSKKNI